ncbi:MAG: hypothetical protein ACPLPR_09420 [Bacillota bacterium]
MLVVGVCVSGKSTLVAGLRELGYEAYGVAQEHSLVPRLWAMGRPDFVVMLDCKYQTARKRRAIAWGPERLEEQRKRLANALGHCHLYVRTDQLSAAEVLWVVVNAIKRAVKGHSAVGLATVDRQLL